MNHRLATNYAKNYCNRTLIVKVIVENVVTIMFFLGHGVLQQLKCQGLSRNALHIVFTAIVLSVVT